MMEFEAADLDYYEIVLNNQDLVVAMDTLLRRMFGGNTAVVVGPRKNTPNKRWRVYFWATRSEFEIIMKHIDDLRSQMLDEEYMNLIREETVI